MAVYSILAEMTIEADDLQEAVQRAGEIVDAADAPIELVSVDLIEEGDEACEDAELVS